MIACNNKHKHVDSVTVSVEQGMLRGEQKQTITGDATYYSFKGIPYAAPPTGLWRFKAPQPPLPWKGVRNATQHGNVCPHVDALQDMLFIPGSEDCLFLNVYTPSLKRKSSLAVMVFLHGGGYAFGSGNDDFYGPDFIMNSKNVIVVTINYRLDTLGFLCLDTKDVPGNAGLKDQVAALKWVQKNIRNFGGDPKKVTIIGQSAGAAASALHAISPMSRGLFRRVILMSGAPISEFTTEFERTRRAFVLGRNLGFNATDPTELLHFLQSVPVRDLLDTSASVIAAEEVIDFIVKSHYFVTVVEKNLGQEPFLMESPTLSVEKGLHEADTLIGFTSAEGIFSVPFFEKALTLQKYGRYPEALVPRTIFYKTSPETHLELADSIVEFYTGSQSMALENMQQLIAYSTDMFTYPVMRYARRLSDFNRNDNIYMYEFTSKTNRNYYSKEGDRYGIDGVAHIDDLLYLFNANSLNLTIDASSAKVIHEYVTLFTNFAIYG
ncbi:juvenile hormone esterase [Bicyclus anynana]|uniref:Carboxylic ester hydrolase n=1 Tax=Bicyclus anynana TaxID=110368 RepID=A0ABM3LHP1_BICAN|nr:juvenile hormone esterase [Bicyclus anynana]